MIVDNSSIHQVDEVVQMIQGVGAMIVFLPPYFPDYNSIEEAFLKVRTVINYESSIESGGMAFSSITQEDCMHWIGHCGIYT